MVQMVDRIEQYTAHTVFASGGVIPIIPLVEQDMLKAFLIIQRMKLPTWLTKA
jgi:hypothetical protein